MISTFVVINAVAAVTIVSALAFIMRGAARVGSTRHA